MGLHYFPTILHQISDSDKLLIWFDVFWATLNIISIINERYYCYFLCTLYSITLIKKPPQIIHFWKGKIMCFLINQLDFHFYILGKNVTHFKKLSISCIFLLLHPIWFFGHPEYQVKISAIKILNISAFQKCMVIHTLDELCLWYT